MRTLSVLAGTTVALAAAVPATAATWSSPAGLSSPQLSFDLVEAGSTGDGSVLVDWAFSSRTLVRDPTIGAGAAALPPGDGAFGPSRALPRDLAQVVPYARRSVAALARTNLDQRGRRVRLAVAFGSSAGPAVGTARTVAVDDVAFVPRLAVGADGAGLLAWVARVRRGDRRVVKVALRAPGGRFGAPSIISGTGRANTMTAAVGPQGQMLVAFERGGRLLVRFRAARGGWQPTEDLGPVAAGSANRLAALITGGGRATVADVHRQLSEGGDAGPLLVDAWVRRVGARRFGPAQRLEQADGVSAGTPALVAGDGRGALLAWIGGDPGAPPTPDGPSTRVHAAVMGGDGRFGAALPVSAPAQPATGVAAAGNGTSTVVSWIQAGGPGAPKQVVAALRPAGGGFGPPELVATQPDTLLLTAAALTARGEPVVAWAGLEHAFDRTVTDSFPTFVVRASRRLP